MNNISHGYLNVYVLGVEQILVITNKRPKTKSIPSRSLKEAETVRFACLLLVISQ